MRVRSLRWCVAREHFRCQITRESRKDSERAKESRRVDRAVNGELAGGNQVNCSLGKMRGRVPDSACQEDSGVLVIILMIILICGSHEASTHRLAAANEQ